MLAQTLQPKLADRLQHEQAWLLPLLLRLLQQTLVQQRGNSLDYLHRLTGSCIIYGCGCLQGAAAHKDREPAKEMLLFCTQQVVAPLESVAQCLLPQGQIACTTGQD